MNWREHCVYCQAPLYRLGDGMLKCSRCRKKMSPRRIEKILDLIAAFARDENANEASRRLSLSYVSVYRFFAIFRQLAAQICEHEYERRRHLPCEYEEYFYLAHAKRRDKHSIFDAQNFLTFDYGGHLYNIVMPSLHQYRQQFIDDDLLPVYAAEFSRFKRQSRLIKVSSWHNNIVRFWDYFETNIVRYKGVGEDQFPLYLKEMELKFNHSVSERETLLSTYYFKETT